jgi:hypothetical protein
MADRNDDDGSDDGAAPAPPALSGDVRPDPELVRRMAAIRTWKH